VKGRRGRGRGGGAIQCLASGRHRLSCATGCVHDVNYNVFIAVYTRLCAVVLCNFVFLKTILCNL